MDLDELDEAERDEDLQEDTSSSARLATDPELIPDSSGHVKLGSMQEAQSFQVLEESRKSDVAFQNFRTKLNNFLNILLPTSGIPLLGGKCIQLTAKDQVVEHRFLRVNFKSMVDWKEHADYLWCSPSFYNAPSGAMVVLDFGESGDYLVVDGIDTDMFLWMNTLHKAAGF
ncbi:hypothetical protein PAXRUDRAFT_18365 [Paxillus rubicundulus Ve08.2h10]|uniref:Uncharacterized protein n=1 Tax=Paxillus rubicundulus Ve08.2h10 TaxID=930991 RepID=A0A0D0DF12_9AGAM|nr:hypothetical protein PAXRUDRAFT_18365 [Paxillus rubicundulus Ve08.2h10]